MKTYQAVRAQIAKLEKEAEELRRQELRTIIAQVRQVIADYGLTAADLGLGGARAAGRKRAAAARGAAAGVAKYRDPKTGQTWTGRGRPPAWIADAKNRDAFLIDAPAAAPGAKKRAAKVGTAAKNRAAKAKPSARGRKGRAVKTAAVEIESGVAME
ncbi:H-NS histone family protein [uncultured Piscinibacter sp.]|uniref:H-NS histone family protein n=1 Tax=uncultured Piscinibacter sp. TaxID=1131835 RepID=UPI00262A5799|nr:H-NS histone family protein [uncultured Piscinibacter sp.]